MIAAPPATEVEKFQFRNFCSVKVSKVDIKEGFVVNLIAASSKHGLIFAGCKNKVRAIPVRPLLCGNEKARFISEQVPHRDLDLDNAEPSHLDVCCNQRLLAIVCQADNAFLLIYDIDALLTAPTLEPMARVNVGAAVNQLSWNPGVENMVACCGIDFSMKCFTLMAPNSLHVDSLPPESGTTCFSFSPKGKQVVVGTSNGNLIQCKLEMKAVKSIEKPNYGQNVRVVAVKWLSTFQFLAVYNDGQRIHIAIVNAPKNVAITYIDYGDLCSDDLSPGKSSCYYLLHQTTWNIILIGAANGYDFAVLSGTGEGNNPEWRQWIQDDLYRIVCQLSDEHAETFPFGVCFNYNSTRTLRIDDVQRPFPEPLLCVYANDGTISLYDALNMTSQFPDLTQTPTCDVTQSPFFAVKQTPVPASLKVTANYQQPFTQTPDIVPSSNFGTQPVPALVPIKLVASTEQAQSPSNVTPVITKATVATPVSPSNVTPVSTKASVATPVISKSPASSGTGDSILRSVLSQDTASKILQLLTSPTPKKESDIAQENVKYDGMITKHFISYERDWKNLKSVISKCAALVGTLGSDSDRLNLIRRMSEMVDFAKELKKTMGELQGEVQGLKDDLVESMSWLQQIKSRQYAMNHPDKRRVPQTDIICKQIAEDIKRLVEGIEIKIKTVNAYLEDTWAEMIGKEREDATGVRYLTAPKMETIERTMRLHKDILENQKSLVKSLKRKLYERKLIEFDAHVKSTKEKERCDFGPKCETENKLNKLASRVLNMNLSAKIAFDNGSDLTPAKKCVRKNLSQSKIDRLREQHTRMEISVIKPTIAVRNLPKKFSYSAPRKSFETGKLETPKKENPDSSENELDKLLSSMSVKEFIQSPLLALLKEKLDATTPSKSPSYVEESTTQPRARVINFSSPAFDSQKSTPQAHSKLPTSAVTITPQSKNAILPSISLATSTAALNRLAAKENLDAIAESQNNVTENKYSPANIAAKNLTFSAASVKPDSKISFSSADGNKISQASNKLQNFSFGSADKEESKISVISGAGKTSSSTTLVKPVKDDKSGETLNSSSSFSFKPVTDVKTSDAQNALSSFSFGQKSESKTSDKSNAVSSFSFGQKSESKTSDKSNAVSSFSFGQESDSKTSDKSNAVSSLSFGQESDSKTSDKSNVISGFSFRPVTDGKANEASDKGGSFSFGSGKDAKTSGSSFSFALGTDAKTKEASDEPFSFSFKPLADAKSGEVSDKPLSFAFMSGKESKTSEASEEPLTFTFGSTKSVIKKTDEKANDNTSTSFSFALPQSDTKTDDAKDKKSSNFSFAFAGKDAEKSDDKSPFSFADVTAELDANTSNIKTKVDSIFGKATSSASKSDGLSKCETASSSASLSESKFESSHEKSVEGKASQNQDDEANKKTVSSASSSSLASTFGVISQPASVITATTPKITSAETTSSPSSASDDVSSTTTSPPLSSASNAPSSTSLFGAASTSNSQPSPFSFSLGSSTPSFGSLASSSATPVFGSSASTSASSLPLFGSQTAASPSSLSVFGSATPAASTEIPLFGSSASGNSSIFGGSSQSVTTTASLFGGNNSFGATGSVFGGTPATTTTASFFGSSPPPSSATSFFGSAANTAGSSPFFSGSGANKPLFGSTSQPFATAFGANPTATTASPFASGSSGGGIFGGTNAFGAPPNASPFGANSDANSLFKQPSFSFASAQSSSPFASSSTVFGQSASKPFGIDPIKPASGTFGAPAFGAATSSPTSSAFQGSSFSSGGGGGFGGPPTFGGGATFGSTSVFGGAPSFGSSPTKLFGQPTSTPFSPGSGSSGFGSSSTFENLAKENTITFGNLAASSPTTAAPAFGTPSPNKPFQQPTFGGSSFSSWR